MAFLSLVAGVVFGIIERNAVIDTGISLSDLSDTGGIPVILGAISFMFFCFLAVFFNYLYEIKHNNLKIEEYYLDYETLVIFLFIGFSVAILGPISYGAAVLGSHIYSGVVHSSEEVVTEKLELNRFDKV